MGNRVSAPADGGNNPNPEVLVEVDDLEVKLNRGRAQEGGSAAIRADGDHSSARSSGAASDVGSFFQKTPRSPAQKDLCRELFSGGAPLGARAFDNAGLVGTEREQLALLSYYATLSEDYQRYQQDTCRTATGDMEKEAVPLGGGDAGPKSRTQPNSFGPESDSRLARHMRRAMEKMSSSNESAENAGESQWPQFVILSGPPGTGKTQHTQAWGRAMGLPLLVVDQKQEGWLGKLDASIGDRDCIVFFDELDGFFPTSQTGGAPAETNKSYDPQNPRFPSQFRQFLDGTARSERNRGARVIVAGTTNALEQIPQDIVHRGEVITFHKPSRSSFASILEKYAAHLSVRDTAHLADVCAVGGLTARDVKVCSNFAERHTAIGFLNRAGGGYAHGAGFSGCAPPPAELYERCLRGRFGKDLPKHRGE